MDGSVVPEVLAPDEYIIAKEGIVYEAYNGGTEKGDFIRILNLSERFKLKNDMNNKELIYKILKRGELKENTKIEIVIK